MGESEKLTALLGSAYLLKKADDRLDDLELKISEINKDVKNILKENQSSQREKKRLLEENIRLLKEIKQKVR